VGKHAVCVFPQLQQFPQRKGDGASLEFSLSRHLPLNLPLNKPDGFRSGIIKYWASIWRAYSQELRLQR
jgi:hypothetical protein